MTRKAKAPPPVFFTGAGYAVVQPPLTKEPRARGTPRVLTDPRASTPRDIEACRSPYYPPSLLTSFGAASRKSAKSDGVPRAVFEVLLREVPGSQAFKGMTLSLPLRTWRSGGRLLTNLQPYRPSGSSARRRTRRELRGLDRRAFRRISDKAYFPATDPRPASGDADQTPLGHEGRDNVTIILIGIKSSRVPGVRQMRAWIHKRAAKC
jgi:hypothetical protein